MAQEAGAQSNASFLRQYDFAIECARGHLGTRAT